MGSRQPCLVACLALADGQARSLRAQEEKKAQKKGFESAKALDKSRSLMHVRGSCQPFRPCVRRDDLHSAAQMQNSSQQNCPSMSVSLPARVILWTLYLSVHRKRCMSKPTGQMCTCYSCSL